jgi:hypothetical protein
MDAGSVFLSTALLIKNDRFGFHGAATPSLHGRPDIEQFRDGGEAVQNCRHNASRNLPGFESEGEFSGWIFRVLINEALRISPGSY